MHKIFNKIITPNTILIILVLMYHLGCKQKEIYLQENNEIVMSERMTIKIVNLDGILTVKAGKGLERSYSWEGGTRSVNMWPRKERWYGSLGIYYPGKGNHWKNHKGVTRGILEEGQQHFKTVEEALSWLKEGPHIDYIYRDDGLTAGWKKELNPQSDTGGALTVDVWQIYIGGKKPSELLGSQNDKIIMEYAE